MKPIFTRGLPDREGASASYLIFDGLAGRIYSSLPLGQRDDGFIAVPAAVLDGCTDIVRGAYPENQVGSAVRLKFPFIYLAAISTRDPPPWARAPQGASPVALRAPCNAPCAAVRATARKQNRQRGDSPQKSRRNSFTARFKRIWIAIHMSAVRDALKLAQERGLQPAGELRSEAIRSGFAEDLLRARGLKSPLGEVRARADLVPR